MAETKHIVTAWAHFGLAAWCLVFSLVVLLIGILKPLPSYAVTNDVIAHSTTDPYVHEQKVTLASLADAGADPIYANPVPLLDISGNQTCVNTTLTNTTIVYVNTTVYVPEDPVIVYRVRETATVLFWISPTLLLALAGGFLFLSEMRQFFLLYVTREEAIPARENALLNAIYVRCNLMVPAQMLFTWALLPVTVIASVEAQILAVAAAFVVYYALSALERIIAVPTAGELSDMLNLFEPVGPDAASRRAVWGARIFITIWGALWIGLTVALLFGVSRTYTGVSEESTSFAAVAFAFYEFWFLGLFLLPFFQYYGLAKHKDKNKSYPEIDFRVNDLYYWEWGHLLLTWICGSLAGGFIAGAAKQ